MNTNSSDYRIDLNALRREHGFGQGPGPAVLRRVPPYAAPPEAPAPPPEAMVVDEPDSNPQDEPQSNPQGMSTEPQSLNETEIKTKDLTIALEKIEEAKKSLDEAIFPLLSEDLPEPVQGIQQGVAQLESVENCIEQIILRLMDSGASHVDKRPHERNDEAMTADEQMARMLQDQERQQLNHQYHPNLAAPRSERSQSDDHEFAMSLQRDSDESLARQIQEEEARRYTHRRRNSGNNRFHAQQNVNVPSHIYHPDPFRPGPFPQVFVPQQGFGPQGFPPEVQQMFARHQLGFNHPGLDLDDSDEFSEPFGGQPHFPIMHLGRGRGRFNPMMFHQLGLQGQDMDDIIRGLEMQNRGATTEDIENFSNEEQYMARPKPAVPQSEETKAEEDNNHDEQCCICMEKFQDGDNIRRLPCLHIFHRDEIDQWLMQNRTCPICKTSIEVGGQN